MTDKQKFIDAASLKSKKVLVCGLQRSGMDAADFLIKCGACLTVSDIKKPDELKEQLARLEKLSKEIRFELGFHSEETFASQDLIVLSPAVACDSPFVLHALSKGVKVVSEVEFASWFARAPYAAITGTNGKTTTTTLVYEILKSSKLFDKVYIGGNIGIAFAGFADSLTPRDAAVLEISSFQMEFADTFAPRASALLNVTEDHLNRHHDMKTYMEMKMRVFQNQKSSDCAVLNADDPLVIAEKGRIKSRCYTFSVNAGSGADVFAEDGYLQIKTAGGGLEKIIKTSQIGIIGAHNLSNAAAAAAMCHYAFGVEPQTIAETLRNFKGVHHRLELVAEINGVAFYNDSKATNEDSARVALRSFTRPVLLIAGGSDKGSDFSSLASEVLKSSVKKVYVIGQVREKIIEALARKGFSNTEALGGLEECVTKAFSEAQPGEAVLLSPACASLDMFKNYEHRGEVFIEQVVKIKSGR
ncbi:MAG TPA: UDP-N-acetylmuramoyl-L-alanine--D-glutamate ligase [Candidatus Wallbacteria bacterium]|nr:MAG: UDP-N-acetylmuramoylalanine--D-glutamate ligase [bacterium ADurb.Bin243]HPG59597.1 UDP-N-acetylmuramoyl-L-alanine--D-glutamate ligase [Candidatus Wallbacteria bacterium]